MSLCSEVPVRLSASSFSLGLHNAFLFRGWCHVLIETGWCSEGARLTWGLNAGRGSKFLTAKRAESFIEGVRILKYLLDASPCGIYWGCLVSGNPRRMAIQRGELWNHRKWNKDLPSPCLISRGNHVTMRKLHEITLQEIDGCIWWMWKMISVVAPIWRHPFVHVGCELHPDEWRDHDNFGRDFRRPFFQVLPLSSQANRCDSTWYHIKWWLSMVGQLTL